jgi:hypothetical protein
LAFNDARIRAVNDGAGKVRRQSVSLPAKSGEVDEDTIEAIMDSAIYWAALKPRLDC